MNLTVQADSPSADQDVDHSVTETPEHPSSSEAQDVTAESSPVDADDAEPKSLLDIVKQAVPPSEDDAEPAKEESSGEPEGEATDAEGEAAAKAETKPEADDANLPFGKHPRFKQLLQERATFMQERDQATQELETLRPQAERFRTVTNFLAENEIPPEDLGTALKVLALMRSDPDAAREMLAPTFEYLNLATGKALPPDLQTKVDEGYLDAETAAEHARMRMQLQRSQQQGQRQAQRFETERSQAAAMAVRDAVNTWEANLRSRSPDYDTIRPFVLERVQVLLSRGRPSTPEASVALAEQAYKEVQDRLRPFQQKRQPTRPSPDSVGSVTPAQAAPKSLAEAIARAAQGS